jgi:hypothetical protein
MAFDGEIRDLLNDKALREQVARRAASLKTVRKDWELHWQEVARYTQPRLGLNLGDRSASKKGGEVNSKLLDSHGIKVANTLANGMTTGMSSPAMPWFKLSVEDPDLVEFQEVKEWLAMVEERLYSFFARTNFYAATKTGYAHIGVFGTSACLMQENWAHDAVNYPIPCGDYWIGLDEGLVANTMLRRCDMTVIQLMEKFGEKRVPLAVKEQYARGDYQRPHVCWHLIEPNNDRGWGRMDKLSMPYRSYYWTESDAERFLSVGGYEERPFWAPRWETDGADVYGRSPAMDALPDLRQLQYERRSKNETTDYIRRPALIAPTQLNNTHASLIPRGLTTMSGVDKDNFRPIWEVPWQLSQMHREDIAELHRTTDELMFADLFMAITNMPGVQPRNIEEIARRNEEKLTQLGPVVDRNQNEQLKVAIDRAFGILNRQGMIAPAPEAMQGTTLRVEFVGLLAQMQMALGIGPIERTVNFIGGLVAVQPSALDKLDIDQTIDEYARRVGSPPKMVRSDEEVAKLRASRAKQEQMAQMAQMAPAAKDGATAAKLMSELQTPPGPGHAGPALALGL